MAERLGGGILLVCTANVCRSPVAELILRQECEGRGVRGVPIASAGLRATQGTGIDRLMASLLAEEGIQSEGFRSHRLGREDVEAAGLILTATAAQRTEVVKASPRSLSKTFSMRELVFLTGQHQGDGLEPVESVRQSALRARPYHSVPARDMDIDDPTGRSLRTYRSAYRLLRETMESVAERLASVV
ncbi:MAG: hypothetical protein QM708_11370 [Propioniciclava sp.]|uniref:arsenate reductase/protein-tyrosine-phosphatase family protein n=1 Tax=Propioniciclava sp. TaxID=2038686 RepID=UPI0039E5E2CF